MSPVESKLPPSTLKALIIGAAGVLVAIGLIVATLAAANSGNVEIRIGDDDFDAGDAESRAEAVARDGPILFSDVSGGERDIILQHLGDDAQAGWLAFDAHASGASRDCFLEWDAGQELFLDSCDGTAYPADGAGLTTYDVTVIEGDVVVSLRE